MRRLALLLPLLLVVTTFAEEGEPAKDEHAIPPAVDWPVDFVKDVQPIFARHCNDCHGADAAEGRLRMDARHIVAKGGISGPLFEPGNSEGSLLLDRLVGAGGEDQMPLDGDPLTDAEIGILRAWIDQGAKWPDGVGSDARDLPKHWAYEKPMRPKRPAVANAEWTRNAIDEFVLAKLEEKGLEPSPEADKARLLRRVSLDLTGLPPTIEELDAFLADDHHRAYERAVDRLLASERFGEKWARHWLDLARYADSNGFQADQYREVWPYRDWVIDALNADMPFDQFTVEQIAGDLLPNATAAQKIATGFHRQTTCNVEAGVDPEENRVNQVFDRVNTTGTVWLGTSFECIQCHGHPYDPFAQRDYYRLFAFFNNTPMEVKHAQATTYEFFGPKMPVGLSEEQRTRIETLRASKQSAEAKLEGLVTRLRRDDQPKWETAQLAMLSDGPDQKPSGWQLLELVEFESKEGASHTLLEDGSVLLSGKNPATDTYTITVRTDLSAVTAFKLETLTHDSLPEKGPGRRQPRANFVLQDFTVTAKPADSENDPALAVELHAAKADYEQAQYKVAGAIDDDPKSGWAIHSEFGKPHWATFRTRQPTGYAGGTELVFTLAQNHGERRTIGRVRLLACEGEPPAGDVAPAAGLPKAVVDALRTPAAKRNARQRKQLEDRFLATRPEVKKQRDAIAKIDKQIQAVAPPTTLVMVEMDDSRTTRVFRRGDFQQQTKGVDPGTPSVLHDFQDDWSPDRLGLARWLASPENPLVARVTVNRLWAEVFGEGIVRTEEDFGTQGERPTHPELLDWLAVEFVENDWSVKHVLRTIVTSSTYRQSSKVTPERLAADPTNKWLGRMPRLRLPAEGIRDNALAASGLLSTRMHGPPVFPPQPPGIWRHVGRNAPKYQTDTDEDRFRRGIYVILRRSAPYPAFVNFDAPDRAACTVQRPTTNTPLQALTLLNDEAYVEMAHALSTRVLEDDSAKSDEDRLVLAFRRCLARHPTDRELDVLLGLLDRERARLTDDPNAAKALVGKTALPAGVAAAEFAAWFFVSNTLLNLDETITKG